MFNPFNLPSRSEINVLKERLMKYLEYQGAYRFETMKKEPNQETLILLHAAMQEIEVELITALAEAG